MRSVAKDNVQQDHRHLGIACFLDQPLISEPVVDHGMGTPTSEEIVAQINDRMLLTGPDIAQPILWFH